MQIKIHSDLPKEDFYVKCNCCGQVYKNWLGSTPCCGSIAYGCDENGGNTTDEVKLFGFRQYIKEIGNENKKAS